MDYALMSVIAYVVSTSVGAALWVARLATRIAVLESSHGHFDKTLQEIRADVKKLVEYMYTQPDSKRRPKKP